MPACKRILQRLFLCVTAYSSIGFAVTDPPGVIVIHLSSNSKTVESAYLYLAEPDKDLISRYKLDGLQLGPDGRPVVDIKTLTPQIADWSDFNHRADLIFGLETSQPYKEGMQGIRGALLDGRFHIASTASFGPLTKTANFGRTPSEFPYEAVAALEAGFTKSVYREKQENAPGPFLDLLHKSGSLIIPQMRNAVPRGHQARKETIIDPRQLSETALTQLIGVNGAEDYQESNFRDYETLVSGTFRLKWGLGGRSVPGVYRGLINTKSGRVVRRMGLIIPAVWAEEIDRQSRNAWRKDGTRFLNLEKDEIPSSATIGFDEDLFPDSTFSNKQLRIFYLGLENNCTQHNEKHFLIQNGFRQGHILLGRPAQYGLLNNLGLVDEWPNDSTLFHHLFLKNGGEFGVANKAEYDVCPAAGRISKDTGMRCWYLGDPGSNCLEVCRAVVLEYDAYTHVAGGNTAEAKTICTNLSNLFHKWKIDRAVGKKDVGCSFDPVNQTARVWPDEKATGSDEREARFCACQ